MNRLSMPGVGIDAPIAQERPAAADLLDARGVDPSDDYFLPVGLRRGNHDSEGI